MEDKWSSPQQIKMLVEREKQISHQIEIGECYEIILPYLKDFITKGTSKIKIGSATPEGSIWVELISQLNLIGWDIKYQVTPYTITISIKTKENVW